MWFSGTRTGSELNISTTRECKMFCPEYRSPRVQFHSWLQKLPAMRATPRPGIAKDILWDDMNGSGIRSFIRGKNTNESFVFVFSVFGVFNHDIPITIFVEAICVKDFEFP